MYRYICKYIGEEQIDGRWKKVPNIFLCGQVAAKINDSLTLENLRPETSL